MLVEPLADVDANVPGVMAILVAPAAAQLSLLLAPELMLVGFAANEVIVGTEPFPDGEPAELVPQLASPIQADRMTIRAQPCGTEVLSPRELSLFPQNEFVEFMPGPFVAAGYTHSSLANSVYCPRCFRCSSPWS